MDASFNIVDLIENNPIARLNGSYQNRVITKIKEKFTENQQQIFVASFYSFLNYDSKKDFVIDLDNAWKWLGFSYKHKAKELLNKMFILNKDYKSSLTQAGEQTIKTQGGHNREIIMLNIETFKKFCLKAGTKKADEIHDYYIRLEETLQEVIQEESNELKLQLEEKTVELEEKTVELKNVENLNYKIREKTLIEQYGNNVQCIYYGTIDNKSNNNEKLIKFGNSNNLKNRVRSHKSTYMNFRLVNVFKVENKLQIENAIKEDKFFMERIRMITLKNKKYIELLNAEDLSFACLDNKIKEIITNLEFSPENYKRLLKENKELKAQLYKKHEEDGTNDLTLLKAENDKLKVENLKLKRRAKKDVELVIEKEPEVTEKEIENYAIIMKELKKHKFTKNADGTYNIDDNNYEKLEGTRQEVWDNICYKTSGGLTKDDFIINDKGKIVSKKKSLVEKNINRLGEVNEKKKKK